MKFSAFAKFGHLRFSGKPTHGETFYKQIKNAFGGQYATTIGTRSEAWMFATAMALARVRYAKERAANQSSPQRVIEMLPVREMEYGLIPGRYDTIIDRQRALAAKMLLPEGARYTAVTAALQAAIGSDFLYYRTTKAGEIVAFPADPGEMSGGRRKWPGNWTRTVYAPKVVRLTSPASIIASDSTVHYEPVEGGVEIKAGDVVVVGANNIGQAELMTVVSASSNTFTGRFKNAHDVGDICTTSYFPYWISTQRHVLVVVTPSAAVDPEKRRKVNVVMAEVMRGVTTWDTVPDDGSGTATAAFTVGDSVLGRIGYAGLTSVAYP